MRVTVSPRALRQLEELVAWWRENRTRIPDHLEKEFGRVLKLVGRNPGLGTRYRADERYRIHRLKKTPYFIFYFVDEAAGVVQLDGVWSAQRGQGPPLG